MAKIYGEVSSSAIMTFDKSFARANGQPLDKSEVYYNLEEAKVYAATDIAYVGQIISVVENNTVNVYKIVDTAGNLELIGTQADWEATSGVAAILNKPNMRQGEGGETSVVLAGNTNTKATYPNSLALGEGAKAGRNCFLIEKVGYYDGTNMYWPSDGKIPDSGLIGKYSFTLTVGDKTQMYSADMKDRYSGTVTIPQNPLPFNLLKIKKFDFNDTGTTIQHSIQYDYQGIALQSERQVNIQKELFSWSDDTVDTQIAIQLGTNSAFILKGRRMTINGSRYIYLSTGIPLGALDITLIARILSYQQDGKIVDFSNSRVHCWFTFLGNAPGHLTIAHLYGDDTSGAVAIGLDSNAQNLASIAIGKQSKAIGKNSIALGYNSSAYGQHSMAVGHMSQATGEYAFAYAQSSIASGMGSIALGRYTKAEGNGAIAIGSGSSENPCQAIGAQSFAFGYSCSAKGWGSIAGGIKSIAWEQSSIAMGTESIAKSVGAIAFGKNVEATGSYSFALGMSSIASGAYSFSFGCYSSADSTKITEATGDYSFAFGQNVQATGHYSFAFGQEKDGLPTEATGNYSFAFGQNVQAKSSHSLALGTSSITSGTYSFAFGENVQATGGHSFAFGTSSIAGGAYSFAFGCSTLLGPIMYTEAQGRYSFAFGQNVKTKSDNSFAFGKEVQTDSFDSIALGSNLKTLNSGEVALGANNSSIKMTEAQAGTAFTIGKGFNSKINAANLFQIDTDGTVYIINPKTYNLINIQDLLKDLLPS